MSVAHTVTVSPGGILTFRPVLQSGIGASMSGLHWFCEKPLTSSKVKKMEINIFFISVQVFNYRFAGDNC